jgi:hypothetical protein
MIPLTSLPRRRPPPDDVDGVVDCGSAFASSTCDDDVAISILSEYGGGGDVICLQVLI